MTRQSQCVNLWVITGGDATSFRPGAHGAGEKKLQKTLKKVLTTLFIRYIIGA